MPSTCVAKAIVLGAAPSVNTESKTGFMSITGPTVVEVPKSSVRAVFKPIGAKEPALAVVAASYIP